VACENQQKLNDVKAACIVVHFFEVSPSARVTAGDASASVDGDSGCGCGSGPCQRSGRDPSSCAAARRKATPNPTPEPAPPTGSFSTVTTHTSSEVQTLLDEFDKKRWNFADHLRPNLDATVKWVPNIRLQP